MSRTALSLKNKIIVLVAVILVAAGITSAIVFGTSHKKATPPAKPPTTAVTTTNPDDIKYAGVAGQTALATLEKLDNVQVKHYSFGDEVISINGVAGNGPKYWTFYVNSKEASVGAGSYVAKAGDQIEWKLQ